MANYVLVHGGEATGQIWNQVAPLLQEHGHYVFCPTLSNPENSGLSDHISEVCSLIENEHINNVILVGHSYGGMVITGIADRMPEKIDRSIYVDSVVILN
ncbi:MAG: alpha/beta hydrolase [Euryarchaeota archaeon]|nr:alpha/beta hydrolase [Euryarchaeota archaeon]